MVDSIYSFTIWSRCSNTYYKLCFDLCMKMRHSHWRAKLYLFLRAIFLVHAIWAQFCNGAAYSFWYSSYPIIFVLMYSANWRGVSILLLSSSYYCDRINAMASIVIYGIVFIASTSLLILRRPPKVLPQLV